MAPIVTVGMNHEQQHQELLLMDVKHVLARNPLRPVYRPDQRRDPSPVTPMGWRSFEGGRVAVGSDEPGFTYDHERPRHVALLEQFQLASRPVTAGEYRVFMADGGYERPELWLADGWDLAQREGWRAPLYWEEDGGVWRTMTLGGLRDVDACEPICHVSYFEADAYATWAGCRLPTEFEWEHASEGHEVTGTVLESGAYHPRPPTSVAEGDSLAQLFGDVWEWTSSPYAPYPGYEPFAGELGEYNGKFMINQMVLRGGCCVTPERHMRRTYRNFYYPQQRWMFAGFRLAK
jgi:ergothioneine biosynthesis protein EgtB